MEFSRRISQPKDSIASQRDTSYTSYDNPARLHGVTTLEKSTNQFTLGKTVDVIRAVYGTGVLIQHLAQLLNALHERVESNTTHVQFLKLQREVFSQAENLVYTHTPIHVLQDGVAIHAFGDSRSKVDMNASKRTIRNNLPEAWTHEGGFILGLQAALQNVGVEDVAAHPHAIEGDTSEKISSVLNKETDAIIREEHGVILVHFSNGNDFRALADNFLRTLSVAISPHLADTKGLRVDYEKLIESFTQNTLADYRKMQEIYLERKKLGKDTSLIVVTQPPFEMKDWIRLYSLGHNDEPDKFIAMIPPLKALVEGGATLIGGAFTGMKNALEKFALERDILSEDMRIPLSVIPAGDLIDPPNTQRKDSYFDGSFHLSPKGHLGILDRILRRVVIVSKDGSEETFENRKQRHQSVRRSHMGLVVS